MNTLKQNITNMFGEKGREWLSNLPHIVNELVIYWKLNHITPVNNMTFNYVAKAVTNANQPVILKISCDGKTIREEKQALEYFDGNGSIQVIAENDNYHALLLQQAIPGITLKSLYFSQSEYVMDCYVETMRKLHAKKLFNKSYYHHIKDWLMVIEVYRNFHFRKKCYNKNKYALK